MIKTKIIGRKNPLLPEAATKYYAAALHDDVVELNALAVSISNRCTLRRSDVHGVLLALMDIIPEELSAGKMISLGELGTFCVNVKSEGAETAEGFVPSMVTGKKIVYRPTKGLRDKLHLMKVSLAN